MITRLVSNSNNRYNNLTKCILDEKTPLPEDRDMQGFLPLAKSFNSFDFKAEEIKDEHIQKFIRAKRLIEFGTWSSSYDVNGIKLIVVKYVSHFTVVRLCKMLFFREKLEKGVEFEPACIQPDPTENLLEEMKSFNLADPTKSSKSKSITTFI